MKTIYKPDMPLVCPYCKYIHSDEAVAYTVEGTVQRASCDNCDAKFTAELLEDGCVIIDFKDNK